MQYANSFDIMKLNTKRNAPNFYKQGRALENHGFRPGIRFRAQVIAEKRMVMLKIDMTGDRIVSVKGNATPVIDINTTAVLGLFIGMDRVRVVIRDGEILIMALASEERRLERLDRLYATLQANEPLRLASFSHGAGILSHAVHAGLRDAGVPVVLAAANEIQPYYIDHAEIHNEAWSPETVRLCGPMQEYVFDDMAMQAIGPVHMVEAGLPCTAACQPGRAKKSSQGQEQAEDDVEAGHLIMAFVFGIVRFNAAIILLENSVAYASTASMAMYKTQLAEFGYDLHVCTVEAEKFGVLEKRRRLAAVAVTKGIPFSLDGLAPAHVAGKTVGDILDPVPLDDPSWSPMSYLKSKEERDQTKKAAGLPGSWFARQEVKASDTSIPTITKGYTRRRSTDPMLVHPENPELLRLFTPGEAARAKDVPEHLVADVPKSRALEMLGQGVAYPPFRAVAKRIGESVREWADSKVETVAETFELQIA